MRRFLAVPLVMLFALGCLKTVTMRTVIEDDGSVDRLIRVESDANGPAVDSDLKLPGKEGWQVHKSEPKLFEARGKFKTVAAIPPDYEKTHEFGDGDGKKMPAESSRSVKSHRVFRCALFSVHEYTETITDIASRDEFDKGVEKGIELRSLGWAILEKVYGEEFDFADLKAYMDKEVVPRVRRLASAYWEVRSDKRPRWDQRLAKRALEIARELGIEMTEEQMQEDGLPDAVKWAAAKVAELVKRKDGRPFTAKQAAEWIEKLAKDEKVLRAAEELAGKYVEGGDMEQFGKALAARTLGAYFQILGHGFRFDATVVMPGQIVESNGLIDDNEASWSFAGEDVFPGYPMRVRSVAFAPANRVRGGAALVPTVTAAARLAEFAEGLKPEERDALLKAFEESAKAGSIEPLQRLSRTGLTGLYPVLKQFGLAGAEKPPEPKGGGPP